MGERLDVEGSTLYACRLIDGALKAAQYANTYRQESTDYPDIMKMAKSLMGNALDVYGPILALEEK